MECPACHKEVAAGATFCPHCGISLQTAAGAGYQPVNDYAPPAGAYQPPPAGYPPPSGASTGLSNNTAAALAYITFIPAIIFLVVEPYNRVPLIRFHSFQSIGLAIAAFALQILLTILQFGLHFIPLSWILFSALHLLVSLGLFIVWLIAILKASKGEWYKIPVIGDFADKQARGAAL